MSDPQPFACATVSLDAATLLRLRTRYEGCLCGPFLAALTAEAASEAPGTMPG